MTYVPPSGSWESRAPAELGLRADGLAAAIAFHRARESRWARDFMTASGRFIGVADEPLDSRVLGPMKPRGDLNNDSAASRTYYSRRCFRRRMWLWRPPASGVRGGVIQLSRPPSRPS